MPGKNEHMLVEAQKKSGDVLARENNVINCVTNGLSEQLINFCGRDSHQQMVLNGDNGLMRWLSGLRHLLTSLTT